MQNRTANLKNTMKKLLLIPFALCFACSSSPQTMEDMAEYEMTGWTATAVPKVDIPAELLSAICSGISQNFDTAVSNIDNGRLYNQVQNEIDALLGEYDEPTEAQIASATSEVVKGLSPEQTAQFSQHLAALNQSYGTILAEFIKGSATSLIVAELIADVDSMALDMFQAILVVSQLSDLIADWNMAMAMKDTTEIYIDRYEQWNRAASSGRSR